ncbi:MAG: ice-binding protein [Saprospiraceae bacterium]
MDQLNKLTDIENYFIINKFKTMFLEKLVLPTVATLLVALFGSCTNSLENDLYSEMSSANSSIEQRSQQEKVDLGVAGNFVILSKSGITNVYKSTITGDVGSSPITGAAILVTCAEVAGTTYSVDAAGPLPCTVTNATRLKTAVGDMQTAYTNAAGRSNPDFLNLGAGDIGGRTLTPGLYKWTSAVIIPTDVTISGGPNDVWIFQVAGTLIMSSAVRITLVGGAQAQNIFWQTSGAVTFGTTSHFEGIILGQTGINMQTGASINGRMLAQTAVTLQMNTITRP